MRNWNKNDCLLGALNVVVLFLSASALHSADATKQTNIRLLVSLFRHADRIPGRNFWETYPTDPYMNATFPEGIAQLTTAGKQKAYKFGMALRNEYDDFLGKSYFYQEVSARTTDIARNAMTLEVVLAAMYEPSPEQTWNTELPWQPVYMTTVPFREDRLLLPGIASNIYKKAVEEVTESTEAQAEIKKFKSVFDDLSNKTGTHLKIPLELLLLYQTFLAQSGSGLTLPSWTRKYFPDGKLKEAVLLYYRLENYNDTLKRLNGGVLLQKIARDMEEKINGTSEIKVFLYSAQDVTLVALMHVLGVFDNEIPSPCSAIVLELHEGSGEYYVKLVHHLGHSDEKNVLVIPGCNAMCPFEDFRRLVKKYMPPPDVLNDLVNPIKPYI